MKKTLCVICLLLCSCAGAPYELKMKASDKKAFNIPEGCESLYNTSRRIIAVAPFQNNSSLQEGRYEFEQAAAGAGFYGAYARYSDISEELTPKLSEYAQSAVEASLAGMGGAKVVSRAQLEQVLNEQMFQMTIADPDTAVELGLLTGAEYIVTGSVNKITFRYKSGLKDNYNTENLVGIVLSLGSSIFNMVASGWYVDTLLSVNIIDVSTGQIHASHSSEGTAFIGDGSFSTVQALGGAQAAMTSGMKSTMSFMNNEFEMRAYVNEARGGGKTILINRGKSDGIVPGNIFSLQELHTRTDFMSGASTCSAMDSEDLYIVTEYIGADYAWLEEESGSGDARLGSLLRRVEVGEEED